MPPEGGVSDAVSAPGRAGSAGRPGTAGPLLPPETAASIAPPQEDAAFDRWLGQQLRSLHAHVLAEPPPSAMLRLLQPGHSQPGPKG
ncbi:hypothetical protein [Siccirubricoccus phaeus]|uniref:hypothetical protein n=1 Tax=Siccirubricoccus phaeus TaxID=2595053 RepID=UPI0011F3A14C|nr:hypothetical protein [Siccirubricoccus phaeus]